MDLQQRTKRFGWCLILCACLLRLALPGLPHMLTALLPDWKIPFPIYSETGRNVRFLSSSREKTRHVRESPAPWNPEPEVPQIPSADPASLEMDYDCSLRPDLEALLERPLDWSLRGDVPTVLILHTHTTESYTKGQENYRETAQYRTPEASFNMLSIGQELCRILEENGIPVIHDRQVHDYPSYSSAYVHARSAAARLLEQYPSVQLVLDLHRDALEKEGEQVRTVLQTREQTLARLMLVVGTDVSRPEHEHWEENLALGLKLQLRLEGLCPGIMRPLNLRPQRFNQDLHPHALLVEVGTAGNSREEALAAVRMLGEALVSLAEGSDPDAVSRENAEKTAEY